MDTNFLKSLLVTVEAGSIAKAARQQNLTAAAIGQRIRTLEKELGVSLFEKVGVSAKPTVACRNLLPRIRSLVESAETLVDHLDQSGMTGTLRVGAISTQIADTIPRVLMRFKKLCPNVHIHIVPGTSKQLYDATNDKRLDLAIIVQPSFEGPKSRRTLPLLSEEFVVISRELLQESLAQTCATLPYIRYDSASWGGQTIETYLNTISIRPNVLCDLDSLETIAVMVSNGMGFSIVPHWSGLERHRAHLKITSLGNKTPSRDLCVCYSHPPRLPKVVSIFVELCKNEKTKSID